MVANGFLYQIQPSCSKLGDLSTISRNQFIPIGSITLTLCGKKKVIPLVFLLVRLQHQFPSSEDFLSDGVLEKCHHKLDYKINVYNSAFYIKGFLY